MRTANCAPTRDPDKPSASATAPAEPRIRFGTPYPGDDVVFGDWSNRPKPDNYGDAIGVHSE